MSVCFYLCPVFYLSKIGGLLGGPILGCFFFMVFVSLLMVHRHTLREKYGIDGNMAEDLFASMLMYPCVVEQLDAHFSRLEVAESADERVPLSGEDSSSSSTDQNYAENRRKKIELTESTECAEESTVIPATIGVADV
jgi:hypothetical protein